MEEEKKITAQLDIFESLNKFNNDPIDKKSSISCQSDHDLRFVDKKIMSKNERITENIVRSLLQELDYYNKSNSIVVEEQKSHIADITKFLKTASKVGGGGKGAPEFIITSPEVSDFVIIIECKADIKHHQSIGFDNPKDYAVDGAIHYAKHLSKGYNVIAIGVSGQTESELKVSCFIYPKNGKEARRLVNKDGVEINLLIPFDDFIAHGTYDPDVTRQRYNDLMEFSKELHEFMRDHAKLTESEKPLLVSGTLIALRNKPFANSFSDYTPSELQKQWLHVIKQEIEKADIPYSKKNNMTQPYSSIAVHPELGKPTKSYPKGVLNELIRMLNEKVWPFHFCCQFLQQLFVRHLLLGQLTLRLPLLLKTSWR